MMLGSNVLNHIKDLTTFFFIPRFVLSMGKVYFWCVILMRSNYTSTTCVILERVDFFAQFTQHLWQG